MKTKISIYILVTFYKEKKNLDLKMKNKILKIVQTSLTNLKEVEGSNKGIFFLIERIIEKIPFRLISLEFIEKMRSIIIQTEFLNEYN